MYGSCSNLCCSLYWAAVDYTSSHGGWVLGRARSICLGGCVDNKVGNLCVLRTGVMFDRDIYIYIYIRCKMLILNEFLFV